MSIEAYFDKIESLEFKAYFVVMSGSRAFRLALANHPDIRELHEQLRLEPEKGESVSRRAIVLLNTKHDPLHYHPYDIAIAAIENDFHC